MKKITAAKCVAWQPLTWRWPYEVPTQLRLGLQAKPAPSLPKEDDAFWRWALSGRERENLEHCKRWLSLDFLDVAQGPRRVRAVQLVRNTQLAIQIAAPVGCEDLTVLIQCEKSQYDKTFSTVHAPPMTSTPWGRIVGFGNSSLAEIRSVVRGVHFAFSSKLLRLINPLQFFQLGLESNNPNIRTFLWVTALDALLMAANLEAFTERLLNILGEKTFVLPKIDPGGQPNVRVGEVAEDLYHLRSALAHGRLVPQRFFEPCTLINHQGEKILSYPPDSRYLEILEESALFLLTGVLKRIFNDGLVPTFRSISSWKQKLKYPF